MGGWEGGREGGRGRETDRWASSRLICICCSKESHACVLFLGHSGISLRFARFSVITHKFFTFSSWPVYHNRHTRRET